MGRVAVRNILRRCLLRRLILNTENAEDARSSTKKYGFELRAKRLIAPDEAHEASRSLSPDTFVNLRGSFVSSVLKKR